MFEARIQEGNVLKLLMESIRELVTDANFDCSSSGISLQAMDSSHVSLVSFFLRAEGLDQYRADRNISLGINMKNLCSILSCTGQKDTITLKAEDNGDVVNLMFENAKQTRVSYFSLKLMDIDSEHLGIPTTDYQCVVSMPSKEFQRICREVSIIGDSVTIHGSKEGIKFSVKGDMGQGSIVCKSNAAVDDEEEAVTIKSETEVSLNFALRYLKMFTKATPLSGTVTLKMSPDVPLVVEYKIGSEGDMGNICFYLAPKIEEDDE